ncbi:zwei Ig domain protein zig-8 [Phlebotomus papatasi]|uniref:zwei Ig domain protein zig-8 n=1 Tax=Phlebotomus papatasi TaxID=29031 RepID=UPI00248339B8|nr:zwei Ig domain protein zig-8 [Phlebotomus papatasi]XP_055701385.1 zwei Ig domain protein zig-8 [Phlebotomus papatasi]XP_055701386.1 zwei Ig domain protein zig-8 [Phlebotomus papatasi]XP_055701387.1 zwei Ig domain protein zig-8 [Phlebotomus papatasi]XP_055701388.1 zwei Ig domain protein zig-8 [Phlebotomus papatasi]
MKILYRFRVYIGFCLLILQSKIKESFTSSTVNPIALPYFNFDVQRNVTVTVGQTAFIHCRVERLGDKDVSWIRKKDLHILTAGTLTYTSDQRFQVIRSDSTGNWTLQLKYPQIRDSGVYECQINTEPKMSLSYVLNVVELRATVLGPSDLYVKSGSTIRIVCRIPQGPHDLGNVFWYKGAELLQATHANEVYADKTQRITIDSDWVDGLTSRLIIQMAVPSDTGNYSCVPTSVAKPGSVYVHVIIGEHPAAMQHNSAERTTRMEARERICAFIAVTFLVQFASNIFGYWTSSANHPPTAHPSSVR